MDYPRTWVAASTIASTDVEMRSGLDVVDAGVDSVAVVLLVR